MATSTTRKTTSEEWVEISKTCIVLFPFNASHKFQLPLSVGDLVHIHAQTADSSNSSNGNSDSSAPTSPSLTNAAASGGWYSGVSVNTQESGIFPQSYVVILPENTNTEDSSISQASTPISTKLSLTNQEMTNSSLLNEVTSTIVEWATLLKIFSQNKQHNDFKILSQRITCLIQFKNQLLAFKSPKEITFELRDKILGVIDEGRQETGMSIVLRKEMSNIHTYYNSNSRNTTNTILPTSTATDLVLADAENSGVFNLCTMYQERKYLAVQENIKILESLKNDQSSLNGSGGNINNGQNGGGGGGGSMSNLSPSTSSGNIGIISGGGSSTSLRESGEKGTPANTSNTAPVAISSSPVGSPSSNKSSGGGEKVSKFSSSMNLLNSVRIKGKSSLGSSGSILPSLSSSSSSNGSSPSSSAILSSSSSNSSSNLNINGNNTTSSTQSLSNSTISVTSNPQASSLTLNGQNGSQSTSSLNLNSPLQPIGASKKLQASNNPLKGSTGMGGPGIMKKQGSFLSNPASGANNQPSTSAGSSSAASDSSNKPLHTSSQLLVSVNNFLYSSGEFLEMIFTLYNKTENRFVTESYSGLIPPTGLFVEPENPNEKIRTIFKDLDSRDLQGELYLVTRIYRRTSSLSSKDPNSSPTLSRSSATAGSQHNAMPPTPAAAHKLFKKFIGCGVKRIDLSAQQESAFEVLITLYTSSNEAMFHNLHEQIIQENTGSYELITRAKGVVFTVQHYLGEYSHFLNENIAMRNVSISQKMCLPEVILPGYDRNDMYVQIEEGEFSDKNVEVGMLIKNESGMTMNDTIKFANGQQEISEYRTPVLVSGSSGKWGETVRVWMASKSYEKSHLFFLVRQCSEKKDKERAPLAFGYLKFIGDDGAIIKDGVHTIQLYKVSSDDVPIATYINGVNETGGKKDKKGTSDVIRIRTTFVSTCLTQNHLVVNLARWQSFQGDLSSLVKDITFLGSHELVRNLQEIFFNFLSILDQQLNDSPLSMEIFRSFIFIIGVLVDSRTTNYRPALDTYVSKFFGIPTSLSGQPSGMSAHSHLLRSVVKNLDNFQDPSNASRISSSLKALEYIFKMVVASKTKFPNKDTANANDTYQKNLKNVVDILCEIMLSNAPSLIGAQTIALKNFEGMFSDLKRFFTIEEMAIIAVKFMRSIQHLEKNKTFNLLKLKLLSSYLHGQLMLNKDTRKQLHPIVFQTLQFHFGKSVEETDMCLTILGLIVDIMITKSEMRGRDKDEWLLEMMSFFTPILELLQLINFVIASSSQPIKSRRSSSAASLNGASPSLSLSALVSIMSEDQLYDLRLKIYAFILGTSRLAGVHNWEMFSRSVQSNKTFFVDLYESLQHLFISPKFPTDFWTFTVFQLKTILRMTRILEDVTFYSSKEPSKGSTSYDFGMWRAFFMLTTSYLNCKDLQLESVNPAKAIFLKTRCGDVRIEMARVFERVWTTVPIKERAAFIPVLIDPIMKLSISDTMDAKRVATKIYYDMLESEVLQTGGYSDLMTRTIDSLLEIGTGVSDGMTWPTIGAGSVDGKLPFTMKTFQTFFYVQWWRRGGDLWVGGQAYLLPARDQALQPLYPLCPYVQQASLFQRQLCRGRCHGDAARVALPVGPQQGHQQHQQRVRLIPRAKGVRTQGTAIQRDPRLL
ncbi:SH3 domain-containing protein [Cavenderia fasciculata]|uniref:SH3 domain-containing protein n=1 Tax=Cavenderia fasciculata TaxID=261658 RepID=F4PY04_CACFS|nr:SH3 domain-containing protein [Cavenderia fasciculata]EGG19664.1 SH3 domain-containing protein [Cavenderia fasciculata]|eukprot:XP_004357958.1 SH3 domain-containing protein [Cavenderia fasciculata]